MHRRCSWVLALSLFDVRVAPAGYVLGTVNTVTCPAGSSAITSSMPCQAAAAALGTTYARTTNAPLYPSGCYKLSTDGLLYYNMLGSAPSSSATPVCATSGAPRRCLAAPCSDETSTCKRQCLFRALAPPGHARVLACCVGAVLTALQRQLRPLQP